MLTAMDDGENYHRKNRSVRAALRACGMIMARTDERGMFVAAHGLRQSRAVLDEANEDYPNGYPLVCVAIPNSQTRASGVCLPHEVRTCG
jgi:hypothetical protein